VPSAYWPQRRREFVKLAPAEVFFAELERDANGERLTRERVEHFIAYLSEIARRDQMPVADQIELEIDRWTRRAVQLSIRNVVALTTVVALTNVAGA
jgi:hypothetical protein